MTERILSGLKLFVEEDDFLESKIRDILKEFDTDKNGMLEYPEAKGFVEKMFYSFPLAKLNKNRRKWTILKKILKEDKNKDKSLDIPELKNLIKKLSI